MTAVADNPHLRAEDCTFISIAFGDVARLVVASPVWAAAFDPRRIAQLAENPDTRGDTPCLFGLMDPDGGLASWIYTHADSVRLAGREMPWLWTCGLETRPELRGRGLARRLQQESTALALARGYARGSVFSADSTMHIYRTLGYLLPGFASRTLLLRSARPIVTAHVSPEWLRGTVSALADGALWSANRVLRARGRRWSRLTSFDAVDADSTSIADILAVAAARQVIHFNPSPAKLAWKVRHARMNDASIALLVLRDRPTGHPIAYAVLRTRYERTPFAGRYRDFTSMTVMDFALADASERTASALVAHLADRFFASDADVFQLISNCTHVSRAARRFGFLPAGKGMSFCCRVPEDRVPPGVDLSRLENWPVTHFSGDGPFL